MIYLKDSLFIKAIVMKKSENDETDADTEVDDLCTECWDPDCPGCND